MKSIVKALMISILGTFFNLGNSKALADERWTTPEIEQHIKKLQSKYHFNVVEPRCIGDKEDPFEMGATMPDGPFRGQCIDAESNRPPFILNADSSEYIEVANIRHANQWWIGRIEYGSVEKVIYEIIEFGSPYPGIRNDHVEIRFVFKKDKPIRLRSQVVTQNKIEELDDLVVSHNAYGVHGIGFDPYQGVEGKFAILGRMVSTYDRANEEIVNGKGTTFQIELNLSDRQKNLLLINAIHRDSEMIGYKWLYHTLFMNCAVSLFDLMDDTVPRPNGVPSFVESYNQWLGPLQWLYGSNWIAILPFLHDLIFQPSIDGLEARHLVSKWIPTLNEEYNGGEVSQRKTQIHQDTVRNPDHPKLW